MLAARDPQNSARPSAAPIRPKVVGSHQLAYLNSSWVGQPTVGGRVVVFVGQCWDFAMGRAHGSVLGDAS